VNRLGLHARPAAMFVRIASRHRAEIWVSKEGEEVNGKSIMGLMMLAAGQGSKLRIRCDGPDADKAMEELEELIKRDSTKTDSPDARVTQLHAKDFREFDIGLTLGSDERQRGNPV
jgi:Phosphotransferase System HPr (HPr) Family